MTQPGDANAPSSTSPAFASLLVIGRGGMGTVEVALQKKGEGAERIVALKRLLPEAARDKRRHEMFLREARLAAMLTHENVVHAFAYGERDEELFLAMEYVEGETLSRILQATRERGRPLPLAIAAHILADICEGLHAAHELRDGNGQPLNVVHRDASPHNMMVSYTGAVKLLDFGVAKFDAPGITRTGEVKGKMAYMSPEQALGENLDRRSDIFSIGAVLFECVTGQRMWGNGTDVEIMRRLALEEPPKLSGPADIAKEILDLQGDLVQRDPALRPKDARVVADRLRTIANAIEPIDASKLGAWMMDLFASEADRRRKELERAIETSAPESMNGIRSRRGEVRTETRDVVQAVPDEEVDLRRSLQFRLGGIGIVLAMALAGGAWMASKPAVEEAPLKENPTTAPKGLSATSRSVSRSGSGSGSAGLDPTSATPASSVARAATPSPSAASSTGATTTTAPTSGAKASDSHTFNVSPKPATRLPLAAPKPSAHPKRPPDVDPTPF